MLFANKLLGLQKLCYKLQIQHSIPMMISL